MRPSRKLIFLRTEPGGRWRSKHGLADDWSLSLGAGRPHAGASRDRVLARVRDADFVVNVMGYCRDPEVLEAARRRVFLDIHPGFGQMWCALGLADRLEGHDDFVTTGANVGLAQDTGLEGLYPLGDGLLAFSTPEEARAAADEVRGSYRRHARAARDLAEEHFEWDRVLGRLVAELAAN